MMRVGLICVLCWAQAVEIALMLLLAIHPKIAQLTHPGPLVRAQQHRRALHVHTRREDFKSLVEPVTHDFSRINRQTRAERLIDDCQACDLLAGCRDVEDNIIDRALSLSGAWMHSGYAVMRLRGCQAATRSPASSTPR